MWNIIRNWHIFCVASHYVMFNFFKSKRISMRTNSADVMSTSIAKLLIVLGNCCKHKSVRIKITNWRKFRLADNFEPGKEYKHQYIQSRIYPSVLHCSTRRPIPPFCLTFEDSFNCPSCGHHNRRTYLIVRHCFMLKLKLPYLKQTCLPGWLTQGYICVWLLQRKHFTANLKSLPDKVNFTWSQEIERT